MPTQQSEVFDIDSSEAGHLHAHVSATGPWGQEKGPGMSIHLSAPMPGKSPRNTGGFFLSSCRARSRLGRSSKRIVFDKLFPHVGE